MSVLTIILLVILIDIIFDGIILLVIYLSNKDKDINIKDKEYEEFLKWYKNNKK